MRHRWGTVRYKQVCGIVSLPSSFFFGYVKRYLPWVGDNGPKLKRDAGGGVGDVGWLHATVAFPPAFAIDAGIVPIGKQ